MAKTNHPRDTNSCLSLFTSFWLIPFARHTSRQLKTLFDPLQSPECIQIEAGLINLKANWSEEILNPKPSLFNCLIRTYGREIIWNTIPMCLAMICGLAQALLIGIFIDVLIIERNIWKGTLIAISITLLSLIGALQNDKSFLLYSELGIKIRANCNQLLLSKILTTRKMNLDSKNSSAILSLCNTDFSYFNSLSMMVYVLVIPLYFALAIVLLYFTIGIAGVVVQVIMLINIPIIVLISKKLDRFKAKIYEFSNKRIEFLTGLLQGIKVIKVFCWESPMLDKLTAIRLNEIIWHIKKASLKIITFTIVTSFQGLLILFAYWLKIKLGGSLQLNEVFTGISVLMTSHFYISAGVSESVILLKLYKISLTKLTQVLVSPEPYKPTYSDRQQIHIKGVTSGWKDFTLNEKSIDNLLSGESAGFLLKDINLFIGAEKMFGVLGPVGSGKSTLLNTILGECNIFEGEIERSHKIAYFCQEPWIVTGTIKENILMGRELDEERYNKVLECCELLEDIQGMNFGDNSRVGEDGRLLSGGQKARVAMARVIYTDADIYLFDDPFAAIDVKSCKNIVRNCLLKYLGNKIRIVVLNGVDHLHNFDNVIVLNHGYIEFNGSYNSLMFDGNSMGLLTNYKNKVIRRQKLKEKFMTVDKMRKKGSLIIDMTVASTLAGSRRYEVKFSVFYKFIMYGFKSGLLLFAFFLCCLGVQMFYIFAQYWIGHWSVQNQDEQQSSRYPLVLLIITGITIVGTLVRNLILFTSVYLSSKNIHNAAISSILHAPADIFYNKAPKEFIESFTSDAFQVDEGLTQFIANCVMFGLMIIGYIGYVIYVIPANLSNIGAFVVFSSLVIYYCLRPIVILRQKYLETGAPITEVCKETMNGITTLRSLGLDQFAYNRLARRNSRMLDSFFNFFYYVRFYTLLITVGASICLSLNFFFIVIFISKENEDLATVSLTFNIGIMSYLPWFYKSFIDILVIMPSLGRINSFLSLPKEENEGKSELVVTEGKVEFINVTMVYSGFFELALNDMSFLVEGGQHFGIIGKSGSGKSSIFNAFYRLSRLSNGEILIDDQDISQVSLGSLRRQVSIVSQTPFLFCGSIKFNIDAYESVCDSEIERILSLVGLQDLVQTHGLNQDISSLDLSVGQKQLLALSRVLLKNNKIIILDEATANVDAPTERLIQDLISQHFNHKTVISIAHNLRLLRDYDLVMLIDNGCIIDILPPHLLLTRDHSRFMKSTIEVK